MLIIIFLVAILFSALAVLGWLFLSLKKQAAKVQEQKVVPITNLSEIGVSLSESPPQGEEESAPAADVPASDDAGVGQPDFSVEPIQPKWEETPVLLESVPAVADGGGDLNTETCDKENLRLKEELKSVRENAVLQTKNALEIINKLRETNDQLRADNDRFTIEKEEPKNSDEMDHLRAENVALRDELLKNSQETARSREELEAIKIELGRQVTRTQETVTRLEGENVAVKNGTGELGVDKDRALAQVRDEYQKQLNQFYQEIEELRQENERLKKSLEGAGGPGSSLSVENEDATVLHKAMDILHDETKSLEAKVRDIEGARATQVEENKFLQYELTKSRAQAVGLERVCENSKKQIEDLSRQVQRGQEENRELKKQVNILEQSLADLKRLNVELVKREKLSHFEKERNKNEIQDSEKFDTGIDARTEKVGVEEKGPLGIEAIV